MKRMRKTAGNLLFANTIAAFYNGIEAFYIYIAEAGIIRQRR